MQAKDIELAERCRRETGDLRALRDEAFRNAVLVKHPKGMLSDYTASTTDMLATEHAKQTSRPLVKYSTDADPATPWRSLCTFLKACLDNRDNPRATENQLFPCVGCGKIFVYGAPRAGTNHTIDLDLAEMTSVTPDAVATLTMCSTMLVLLASRRKELYKVSVGGVFMHFLPLPVLVHVHYPGEDANGPYGRLCGSNALASDQADLVATCKKMKAAFEELQAALSVAVMEYADHTRISTTQMQTDSWEEPLRGKLRKHAQRCGLSVSNSAFECLVYIFGDVLKQSFATDIDDACWLFEGNTNPVHFAGAAFPNTEAGKNRFSRLLAVFIFNSWHREKRCIYSIKDQRKEELDVDRTPEKHRMGAPPKGKLVMTDAERKAVSRNKVSKGLEASLPPDRLEFINTKIKQRLASSSKASEKKTIYRPLTSKLSPESDDSA